MDAPTTIKLADLPSDPFEARSIVLNKTGGWALEKSAKYIQEQYSNYAMLEYAVDFFDQDLLDAAPSDGNSFIKLGLFPWAEAASELEKVLSLTMLSLYKNSFDSMRRALELVVVGAFFILDSIETEKARAWLKSNKSTPNFKRAIEKLVKDEPYLSCEHQCKFSEFILDIYYRLSDYVHVKGMEKSHRRLTPSSHHINDVACLMFHESSCKQSLDLFIETSQAISLVCVLTIPRLLVGFDLESKFGLNPPLSVFFAHNQSERLYFLIPERFRLFVDELEKNDEGIRSVKEWFDSMPDISEE